MIPGVVASAFRSVAGWNLRQVKASATALYPTGSESIFANLDLQPLENSLLLAAWGATDAAAGTTAPAPSLPGFSTAMYIGGAADIIAAGLLYKIAGASESQAISISFGETFRQDHLALFVMEWTGNATAAVLDGTPVTNDESSTVGLSSSSGSITIGNANSLIVPVHVFGDGGYTSWQWSSGFAERFTYEAEVTGPDLAFGVGSLVATLAGSYSTALTVSGAAAGSRVAGIAAFRGA